MQRVIEAREIEARHHKPLPQKTDHAACNVEIQALKGKIGELGGQLEEGKRELAVGRSKMAEY
jgi:hypothetical protein